MARAGLKREAVALVDEARCIGCTLCIEACPVDAIVGARGVLHAVVAPWCIGCRLCVAPCPVDCIAMMPAASLSPAERASVKARARARQRRRERGQVRTKPVDRAAVIAALLSRKARP